MIFGTRVLPTAYIPTFDGRERLDRALASVRDQSMPCPVVVIDNGSTDGSQEMVLQKYPEFKLVQLGSNHGFGQAMNLAIESTGDGPILLLNNDVELDRHFVKEITGAAEGGTEMVAGVLTRADEPGVVDSAGIIADGRTLMAFDYLEGAPVDTTLEAAPPLGPTGGAGLYDRDAFHRAGGFDPEIFAYYEDLDLALRMRQIGCSCALAPLARAIHTRSSTLGARSASKYGLTGWSRGYLLRRYGVTNSIPNLCRTILYDSCICTGQVIIDHTFSGIRGRLRGWHAAKSLPPRRLPQAGLSRVSIRAAIRARIERYF